VRNPSGRRLNGPLAAADPEPTVPYPSRFWWLTRLSLLGLLLAAALAGLRGWWGWEARRRLDRELAPVIAAGWPVRAEDALPGPVPDLENAAAYLQRAIAAEAFGNTPAASSYSFPDYPPFGAQWETLAAKSVTMNAPVFPLVRKARDYRRFNWGTIFRRPVIAILLPHLNNARQLANTVGDAAVYAHLHGDDAAALEMIRDLRHESAGVEVEPFMVSHLVGVGIEALADARLQVIATGLTIAADEEVETAAGAGVGRAPLWATPNPAPRPATRAQVRTLIAELLDERDAADKIQYAWAGERAMHLDMADWFGSMGPVVRPMFEHDALRMLAYDRALVDAAAEPTWPAARARLAAATAALAPTAPAPPIASMTRWTTAPPARRVPIDYTRLLSFNFLSGMTTGRATGQSLFVRAERRMGAVNLAAHLFRADRGRWPEALDELVPKYLPAVPRDPLAADDRPLGYVLAKAALPDGGDRPVVYSVGRDGVDQTMGNATALPKLPSFGWQQTADEWRDIARWAPPASATRPSTQAVTQ